MFVVQGIIKEAFFNEIEFLAVDNDTPYILRISDIVEAKIRADSDNKRICFKSNHSIDFRRNEFYVFKANFNRFTIVGRFKFSHLDENDFYFHFPESLELENLRKTERTKVSNQESRAVPTFLRTLAVHCEGSFILEDTASEGYGGILLVPNGFPIEAGTTISGKLGFNQEIGLLSGVIVSATALLNKSTGFDSYRVGVSQLQHEKNSNSKQRRKQKRHKTSIQFNLESLLHPGQILTLDVDDISVSGFSGTPSSGSIISNVPIGAAFKIASENTRTRLVNFAKNRLHFQIMSRGEVDGISWMKRMTPFIYPGARCTSKDARELYRIFFQAGAVSNQYLKRHKLHANILVDTGSTTGNENSNIHRWYIGGTDAEADAYVSAIRFSNTCWVLGDIAKASGTETSARDAVKGFFHSFSEYSIASASVGTQMIFWVKDHPMWVSWYKDLQDNHKNLIFSEVKMQYFRVETSKPIETTSINHTPIAKEDYQLRGDVLNSLKTPLKRLVENAFDFTESGTGSYALKEISKNFDRHYSIVETSNCKYLAIVNQIQFGLSVNRFADSLFLIAIEELQLEVSLADEANQIAMKLSNIFEIAFPSVRFLHNDRNDLEGTEMTCLLLYPRAFMLFD